METQDHRPPTPERHVVVVTGGAAPSLVDLGQIDLVVAADSGADTATGLGLTPDVVVGDFDSIDLDALERLGHGDTRIERHPADKDASDLELALETAVAQGATRITVVGGGRGRLSHLLTNAAVLAADRRPVAVHWITPGAEVTVAHGRSRHTISGEVGQLISLVPVAGPARGIVTTGLRWELSGDDLDPRSSRGLSNEMLAEAAEIAVGSGTLLIIHERTTE